MPGIRSTAPEAERGMGLAMEQPAEPAAGGSGAEGLPRSAAGSGDVTVQRGSRLLPQKPRSSFWGKKWLFGWEV